MGLVGIVLTESPPDLLDADAGVIEEARRRQRRHRGMAAATGQRVWAADARE